MAISKIDTGYQPEFALGALYQGENAAASQMDNQLNFIKQFLANQKAQELNPLEVQQAQQNLDSTAYKTTPEYQTGMRDTIYGQGMSNLAAGQTQSALQPFKQKLGKAEATNAINIQDKLNQLNQLNDLIQVEQNPLQRMAQLKARNDLMGMLKETPEFAQKRELKETGTESQEYIAELRAAAARKLAMDKAAQTSVKPPKTGEEALVRYWQQELAAGNITQQQYEQEVSSIFNRRTEKPVQSGVTGVVDPSGNIQLENKPNVAPYTPRANEKKPDPLGIR